MNNKLYTPGEILTIRTNLSAIEKTLGYPIPGGVIDVSELRGHILSPGEVVTVCGNLRRISDDPYKPRSYGKSYDGEGLEMLIGFGLLFFGFLCVIFGWF